MELARPSGTIVTRSVESNGTQTLATDDIKHSDDLATGNIRAPPLVFFPLSRDREQEVFALVSPPPQGDSTNNATPTQTIMPRRGGQLDNWPPLQKPIVIRPPPPNAPRATPNSTIAKLGVIDLT